jgi:hypothetical protein
MAKCNYMGGRTGSSVGYIDTKCGDTNIRRIARRTMKRCSMKKGERDSNRREGKKGERDSNRREGGICKGEDGGALSPPVF